MIKALVIDDNANNLKIALKQLGNQYEVTTVSSSAEAQAILGFGPWVGPSRHTRHEFEIVLCDLRMPPPGGECEHDDDLEMDAGMFLSILAARNGAKFVGLLTDQGHHDNPSSECLDALKGDMDTVPYKHSINGATVIYSNDTNLIRDFDSETLEVLPYGHKNPNAIRGKNWAELLQRLLHQ